jgi:hypothetical protein
MPWQFLPPAIDLDVATLALGLPARTTLRKAGVAAVATSGEADTTVLKLTLGPNLLRIDFTPGLVIELPPPLIDLGLGGVEYNLTTGEIYPRLWRESEIGLPLGREKALEEASSFMRGLVTCTPMAIPPYDPSADPELILTVQQILVNLEGGGGASVVRDVSATTCLVLREAIAVEAGGGGFRIPAEAKLMMKIELVGAPAEVKRSPKIRRVEVECTSIVLVKDGAELASIGRLILLPGGILKVEDVRPLGSVGKSAAVESLIRLFGTLSTRGAAAGLDPEHIEACTVEELLKKEIEEALQPALVQWVRANATIASGLDLRSVLSVAA